MKNGSKIEEAVMGLGGTVKDAYVTLGRHDFVEIIDLPDETAALKLSMKASESGYVELETLRSFTSDELGRILS